MTERSGETVDLERVAGLLIGPLLLSYAVELVRIHRSSGAIVLESPTA